MRSFLNLPLRLLPLLFAAFGACAHAATDEEVRGLFLAAWESPRASTGDPAVLQDYLLYPYLQARRLETRLALPSNDDAVAAFVAEHAGTLPAERLRTRWLLALGRRAEWARYRAHYVPQDDARLRCYALQARIEAARPGAPDPSLEDDALSVWLTGEDMPEACDLPFAWLHDRGALTPARLAQRARLALAAGDAGLASHLLRQLPPAQQAALLRGVRALREPRALLADFVAQPEMPYEAEAIQTAFFALARRDPAAAEALLPRLAARLHASLQERPAAAAVGELHRALGLGLAWSRRPGAVAHFRRVPEALADERTQEWRVRAALWEADWAQALQWLERMPAALAGTLRWRYWHARALEQSGAAEAAHAQYAALAAMRDYYGYLAADRIGAPYSMQCSPVVPDPARLARIAQHPGVRRAEALYRLDLDGLANAEWRRALDGFEPADRRQAARLAAQWGWHVQSIATLARADHWDDLALRYPLPYEQEIAEAAAASGLPAEWIYAVIRQESLFRPDAVSAANARGLMQLLLGTARHVAARHGRPAPSPAQLLQPAINLPLGAAYLRHLIERQQGRLVLALAAYNAGPGAVRRWLPQRGVPADVWIENIPYNETRAYVQRVLEHIVTFSWRREREPLPRLDALMGASIGEDHVAAGAPPEERS